MMKFLVLFFVAIWVISLFFSKKKRLIKDVGQLVQLLFWILIALGGGTFLGGLGFFERHPVLHAFAVLLWFAASWYLSKQIAARVTQPKE